MDEKLWDIKTTAAYLAMSVGYLRREVRLRRVPFFRVGGTSIRFRKSEIDIWLGSHSVGGELVYKKQSR